jgi:hypothetical protein
MRILPQVAAALALLVPAAIAGDLNVSVESAGSNHISVNPGTTVNYSVVGELSDLSNEGLAGFTFNLSFTGGSLAQAAAPTSGDMLHFKSPMGLSNPAGFGGTVTAGTLVQIGGAQNTFNNTFTPEFLSGAVQTGVAWFGQPEVLVTGKLKAPVLPGSYTLSLSALKANVIRQGQTGANFWAVDAAGTGTIDNLVIDVLPVFSGNHSQLSLSAGGFQLWSLDAGAAQGSRIFWVFGSLSGISPGLQVGAVVLPLVPDVWFNFTINHPNQAPLVNSLGVLDPAGHALAAFAIPPGTEPALAGLTVNHAYLLGPTIDFASNPVSLLFLP